MLYLIRGAPGAGKSTLAQALRKAGIVRIVCEADDYFTIPLNDGTTQYVFRPDLLEKAHSHCLHSTRSSLAAGWNVAVANCFARLEHMRPYIMLGLATIIIEVRTQFESIHNVPPEKIIKVRNSMQSITSKFRADMSNYNRYILNVVPEEEAYGWIN